MLMLVMSGNLSNVVNLLGSHGDLFLSFDLPLGTEDQSACQAATKAFLVNAVADVGLSFGIISDLFHLWDS